MVKLFLAVFFFIACNIHAQDFQKKKLDSLLTLLEKRDKLMGSLAVQYQGSSVYVKSIGYADLERQIKNHMRTQFRIGSVTKIFTATMVMQLIDEGRLSLMSNLSEYYPQLPYAQTVTIQQLLQHEAGYFDITNSPDFKEWMVDLRSKDEILARISENGNVFEPGSDAKYSNTNYILLGFILEEVEKKSYAEVLNARIIRPLNLRHTSYGPDEDKKSHRAVSYKKNQGWVEVEGIHLSIPSGAGAITSTPEDLNLFMNSLLSGKIISNGSIATMRKLNKRYAMGLNPVGLVEGEEMIGHAGSMDGFRSLLVYLPNRGLSVSFTFNAVDYSMKDLVTNIFDILLHKDGQLSDFKPVRK